MAYERQTTNGLEKGVPIHGRNACNRTASYGTIEEVYPECGRLLYRDTEWNFRSCSIGDVTKTASAKIKVAPSIKQRKQAKRQGRRSGNLLA